MLCCPLSWDFLNVSIFWSPSCHLAKNKSFPRQSQTVAAGSHSTVYLGWTRLLFSCHPPPLWTHRNSECAEKFRVKIFHILFSTTILTSIARWKYCSSHQDLDRKYFTFCIRLCWIVEFIFVVSHITIFYGKQLLFTVVSNFRKKWVDLPSFS